MLMNKTQRKNSLRQAFTLIELLIVIAIIITISTILVASYFGMVRGSSYAAVEKNVYNALTLARQRACIDRMRVCLLFQSTNDFVLVRSAGRVTGREVSESKIFDAYADFSGKSVYTGYEEANSIRLYNMDRNGSALVVSAGISKNSNAIDPVTGKKFTRDEMEFRLTGTAGQPFEVGDHYGLELYQLQRLPRGFSCTVDIAGGGSGVAPNASNIPKVIFEPDGRLGQNSVNKIDVYEVIKGKSAAYTVTFKISPEGKIVVESLKNKS
jgi:prepilin-type N-terminal cleavage/methylation domain-containing protein